MGRRRGEDDRVMEGEVKEEMGNVKERVRRGGVCKIGVRSRGDGRAGEEGVIKCDLINFTFMTPPPIVAPVTASIVSTKHWTHSLTL